MNHQQTTDMRKLITTLAAVLALAATSTYAQRFAYGPVGGNPPPARTADAWGQPGERLIMRLSAQLNLTSEQRAQLEQVAAEYRPELQEHRSRMQAARIELDAVAGNANATEEEIDAAAARVADEMAQGAVLRRDFQNALRACLTPEQQAELDRLMEQGFGPRKRINRVGPGIRGKMRGQGAGMCW